MQILDIMWFIIKFIGLSLIILFLSELLVNIVKDIIKKSRQEKVEDILYNVLQENLKHPNKNIDIKIASKEDLKKILEDEKDD